MDRDFIVQRITATKALIVAYEDALTALGNDGGIQSYTIDTQQTRQTVTQADIPRLNDLVTSLYNRLATLEARLNGTAIIARPCW